MGRNTYFDKIRFLPYKERIGDIAVTNFYMDDDIPKPLQGHLDIPPFSFFEIVKYQPNPYFGKEDEYDYDTERESYKPKGYDSYYYIDKSCFKNPEQSYMLAHWVDMEDEMGLPDLKIISNRLLDLSEEEQHQFLKLAAMGQKHIESVLKQFMEENEVVY